MKKLNYLRWLIFFAAAVSIAAGFSPGSYPLNYVSPQSNSGVATFNTALLQGCEFANGSATAQNYMIFDARAIPADGSVPACSPYVTAPCMAAFNYKCAAKTTCSWQAIGPGVVLQGGGTGIVMKQGIAWSNSSTFPNKTIGAADSVVECTYFNYSMGPPVNQTPTPTPLPPTPTSTPFPM